MSDKYQTNCQTALDLLQAMPPLVRSFDETYPQLRVGEISDRKKLLNQEILNIKEALDFANVLFREKIAEKMGYDFVSRIYEHDGKRVAWGYKSAQYAPLSRFELYDVDQQKVILPGLDGVSDFYEGAAACSFGITVTKNSYSAFVDMTGEVISMKLPESMYVSLVDKGKITEYQGEPLHVYHQGGSYDEYGIDDKYSSYLSSHRKSYFNIVTTKKQYSDGMIIEPGEYSRKDAYTVCDNEGQRLFEVRDFVEMTDFHEGFAIGFKKSKEKIGFLKYQDGFTPYSISKTGEVKKLDVFITSTHYAKYKGNGFYEGVRYRREDGYHHSFLYDADGRVWDYEKIIDDSDYLSTKNGAESVSENIAKITALSHGNRVYFYLDKLGKKSQDYSELTDFQDGYAIGISDSKPVIIDKDFHEIPVDLPKDVYTIHSFSEGRAIFYSKGKFFIINTAGKPIRCSKNSVITGDCYKDGTLKTQDFFGNDVYFDRDGKQVFKPKEANEL
jgi:hypothetical protein